MTKANRDKNATSASPDVRPLAAKKLSYRYPFSAPLALGIAILALSVLTVAGAPQASQQTQAPAKHSRPRQQSAAELAAQAAAASTLPPLPPLTLSKSDVVPDLAQRLGRFKPIKIPFHSMDLTHNQRKMINKLVDAAGLLDCIYWRQSDPEGLQLYVSLAKSRDPQDLLLRRYLKINGSHFDLVNDNKPFVGAAPMPPGRGFFPEDMTREALDAYVAQHPAQRTALYDPFTIVQRKDESLEAVPYHVTYKDFLDLMAQDLRDASDLSDDDPAFGKFLRLRAAALLNDNYYVSDLAWLDLQNPKIDIVFAPYETYIDSLLGVKTSYGAAVMVRNEPESQELAMFQKYVPDLQEGLPLAPQDLPSKRGQQSPMEVVDAIYRSGDLLHGYQAVADNLPNDPRVHEQKGSKKIFWKNFMDARVDDIITPLAQRVMMVSQAQMTSGEGYLDHTVMHEIAHGLGPAYAHVSGNKIDIREAIGPQYSALEEAKADVVGMFCLKWLIDHDALPKEKEQMFYASYVAEIFRTVRFGIAEAHGAAEMMEFNYLTEQGAVRVAPGLGGVYEIDFDKIPAAMASLAKELLEQEATGDRARTEAWFKKYAVMPPELSALLAKTTDIPIDVDPDFSFNPPVTLTAPPPAPPKMKDE